MPSYIRARRGNQDYKFDSRGEDKLADREYLRVNAGDFADAAKRRDEKRVANTEYDYSGCGTWLIGLRYFW